MELDITVPNADPKRTPLYAQHLQQGARMVEFAGWSMPLQYDGVLKEHERVRTSAGLFDVSHMGELFFSGPGALATLDHLATNDVAALTDGQALYTPLCNEQGGVRDDVLVYRIDAAHFMVVVNAANTAKILAWTRTHLQPGTELADRTDELALVALQGPRSADILERSRLLGELAARVRALDYYRFVRGDGREGILVSRTGYTGELGFEVYLGAGRASDLWNELLELSRAYGGGPAGLAARDTLRFEVGYCLYGNELDETTTPLEAGLAWTVKLGKPNFLGRAPLERQKAEGPPRRLVGLEPGERVIARSGCEVHAGDRVVGRVTSGSFAPSLGRSLALALVRREAVDAALSVHVRGRDVPARRVDLPFYRPKAAS